MNRFARAVLIAASALSLFAAVAGAHEFWLSPSRYRCVAGDTLAIDARVGTGFRGESSPFAPTHTEQLLLHGAGAQDLKRAGVNGAFQWARWVAADGGGALVTYQSTFKPIQLEAKAFDAYLKLEGLDSVVTARARFGSWAGPGRERFARCAKLWIAGMDAQRATRPAGMPLELIPLDVPGTRPDLRVRLLWCGRPLAGALVRAWVQRLDAGEVPVGVGSRDSVGAIVSVRTAADGSARVPVPRHGEWLVNAVHMVPSAARGVADWDSYWASLTFAR